jgi:hypothetical protein
MRRTVWLVVLILYALGVIADGAYRLNEASSRAEGLAAALPVAFSAALFWPIDIAARRLL